MTWLSPDELDIECFSVILPCPAFRQELELLETMGLIELVRYSREENNHYTFWPGINRVTGYLAPEPDTPVLNDTCAADRIREVVLG